MTLRPLCIALLTLGSCPRSPASPMSASPVVRSESPAVTTPTPSPETDSLSPGQRQRLQAAVETLRQPPFGSGASVSLSFGGITRTFVAGKRWDDGPPITRGTQFNIASVSKLLTAARIVTLANQRQLDLGDSIRQHLPQVHLVDEGGVDRASEVTLEMLLTHSSGLPHQPGDLNPSSWNTTWQDPALLRTLTSNWTIDLTAAPGQRHYSNMGYMLLGAILERLEGQTFAEAMAPFLRDLGMRQTTFWPDALGPDVAMGRVVETAPSTSTKQTGIQVVTPFPSPASGRPPRTLPPSAQD